MKLPRWLVIAMLTTSVLSVLAAAGWWWVTWPERTAYELVNLLRDGEYDKARNLINTVGDGRFGCVVTLSKHDPIPRPIIEFTNGICDDFLGRTREFYVNGNSGRWRFFAMPGEIYLVGPTDYSVDYDVGEGVEILVDRPAVLREIILDLQGKFEVDFITGDVRKP